jgi:hypothetical protein
MSTNSEITKIQTEPEELDIVVNADNHPDNGNILYYNVDIEKSIIINNIYNTSSSSINNNIHAIHNTDESILPLFMKLDKNILVFLDNISLSFKKYESELFIYTTNIDEVVYILTKCDFTKIIICISHKSKQTMCNMLRSYFNVNEYSNINICQNISLNMSISKSMIPDKLNVYKKESYGLPCQLVKKKKRIIYDADEEDVVEFNNNYVINKMNENKENKNKKIIEELKTIYPLPDELLLKLYNKSISIHQSNIQKNGNFLENDIIVSELTKRKIPFKSQVTINKSGIIVGFGDKKNKCYHIIDFVIGNDISIEKSITEYKVLSCKTTCRERWTQDDWSFTHVPLKYILLTISDDYPPSERFRESEYRKIITCLPKLKDDRNYKLNFEDLINELI